MAKYKAYPEYKDSGVEWLGEVPKHWVCTQVKYGYEITLGKMLQKNKNSPSDELKPYLKAQNIQPHGIDLNNVDLMWFSSEERKKLLLKYNDVLVSEGGDVGRSAIWSGQLDECYLQNAINRARSINNNSSIFFNYWITYLKAVDFINTLCNKATIAHYTAEKLETSPLLLPKNDEQLRIAAFLDHETAKIDNLIEKQQQLIELLKEKRQAVISHAVTKGLNPDVPMKDSGVEWLGEVPVHWDVCAIKNIVSTPITDGPHETPNFIDEGVSFISAEAISSGVIDFNKQRACISSKDNIRFSKKYTPQLHDIYMVKSGATTGVTAIVETEREFNIWSPLAAIRCDISSHPYFVLHFLRSSPFQTAIELNWSFGTQQNIGMGVIGNLRITRPPVNEAIAIANHLRAKCSKIEELLNIANSQISLMQERRTALISAAVTGKIDVRDWVAPDASDIEILQEATA